ncbi:hypothetical protein EJ05DRAFT_489347 [Pseudovirgaria hyperparasitica]|uniref:Uncharacterized protein n=1 Tax=Pseudovirgaria hyperparasitica TaxID=470096 RepID=A0A6A6VU28_9PEZI|nr:uncharacterized protein EJ05DRAFT_489347 [Pseudovirgaria hyperparasitica]KAF2754082.1 hypothetical protein EJ05DRAFT_489347 [Pseudovirgaria hyperparasitica]
MYSICIYESKRQGGRTTKRPKLDAYYAQFVGFAQIAVEGMHALALAHDRRNTEWEGSLTDAAFESNSKNAPINLLESTPTAIFSEFFSDNVVFTQVAARDSTAFAITNNQQVYECRTFRDNECKTGFIASHGLVNNNGKIFAQGQGSKVGRVDV